MRTRLNLLTLGVTSLVVIAFVIPLGFLVKQQADQRGRLEAERTAQTLAAVVVRATAGSNQEIDPSRLAGIFGPIPDGSAIVLPSGTRLGDAEPDAALIDEVTAASTALSAYNDNGFGIAIPVVSAAGTTVVYSSVTTHELDEGVLRAWSLLGLLGIGLIGAALLVSDRLGRSVVGPSERIAMAAEQLGHGELETRVEEEGPEELVAIAASFNRLARRIRALLAAEREQVADLSHRLRTPLAALRLQAEQLAESPERDEILAKVDRMGEAVDELITEARHGPTERPTHCDIGEVLRSRAGFWKVLADDQGRQMHVELPEVSAAIAVGEAEAAAAIDALIGNVFSYTSPGDDFGIAARVRDGVLEMVVADAGPGFPSGFDPTGRGHSGIGSSGLGLDIVRRLTTDLGGEMRLGESHLGGARVELRLPLIDEQEA